MPTGTMVADVGTPSIGDTLNVLPLQIVSVCADITGLVFKVTVNVKLGPTHVPTAPDFGVIVYNTVWFVLLLFVNV